MRLLVLLVCLAPVAYWGALYATQRNMLFPGMFRPVSEDMSPPAVSGAEVVWVETEAGPVEGWLFVGKGRTAENPGPGVLYGHGNFETLQLCWQHASWYADHGVTVLMMEYRGFGRSPGKPSEASCRSDGVLFYDALAGRPEVDPERIAFHGRSLGGGVVCAIAQERRPAALILESTFTSVTDIAVRMYAPSFLVTNPFRNEAFLRTYDGPVLMAHGNQDPVVPYEHAERNRAAAAGEAELMTYAGLAHELDPVHPDWHRRIVGFLAGLDWIEKAATLTAEESSKQTTGVRPMTERSNAVTLKGNPMTLVGEALNVGDTAPAFTLVANDMSAKTLADYEGKVKIISVVPSVDTPVCDTETRRFNAEAADLGDDVVILTVSVDTPFAQKRWCGAAGIDKVETLSDFKDHAFGISYGVRIKELGILARQVFVLDKDNKIVLSQLVPEVAEEPDYAAILAAAKSAQ